MKTSIRPLFHLCLVGLALLLSPSVYAQDEAQRDTIEVHYNPEYLAPYKERHSNWSTIFSVGVDNVYPEMYRSPIGGETFADLFGETDIVMVQAQLGAKYNFSLGSLGASLFYGYGKAKDDRVGEEVKLTLQRKGVQLTYTMDALFSEPYFAPYIAGQVFNFDYKEEDSVDTASGETAFTTGVTVGVLVQLNALDPASALTAQSSAGLENTFLNIYMTQFNSSESADDPDFQTSFNWGASLTLEF